MKFDDIELWPVKCRQSCASCALTCERKWFLQYRMGVRLRGGEFKEAADLGTIYHRLQLEGVGGEEEVKKWLREKQVALVAKVEAGEDLSGNLARTANKLFELYNIAEAMFHIFVEKFPQPEWFKTIGKETKHEFMLDGVLLSGTIDKLLLDTHSGNVWIRDHKSTGRALASLFAGAAWGLQGRIYRLLAKDYLHTQGDDVLALRGFILDGITRPGIKLCKTDMANAKKWNCTAEEAYLRRVKEWYRDAEGQRDQKLMRSLAVMFTESPEPAELVNVLALFRNLAIMGPNPAHYDRDVTRRGCFAWERECIYKDLCDTDPGQWDSLFEKKYFIKPYEETEE